LFGSEFSVPALAPLLNAPAFATAARNALEAIPGRHATKALRDSLSKVEGLQKVGVIHSLGARRDADSVRALASLLKASRPEVAAAAAAALGDIATAKSAKALSAFLPKAPVTVRPHLADALLKCAEGLLATGARVDAGKIYRTLDSTAQPAHVRFAAALGLKAASARSRT
jgi:HEAT repeat protein